MLINQSQTACDVFHSRSFNTQVAQPQQQKILNAMAKALFFGWPDDFTIGELADLANLDKSAVSGRRHALLSREDSPIERGEDRECSISGRKCETVQFKASLFRSEA